MFHRAETENPAGVAARFRVEAADADVDANKGSLLPEVNLVGNASRNWDQGSTIPDREDTAQVLVQLSMPLFISMSFLDVLKLRLGLFGPA
ncbi:TolC family protein [Bradyrhizobium sp. LTSP857]|uniref:TolC family protein n=1 Tax=Bradyrhizobium sp. LTSP857 TaxID=1619231 RepID=UPI0005D1795B|nr:TolC family protein [Bradyrhizobium sp. LTSP857]KJC45301.1 hypothetical protein UP06_14835 [Bradyrhizobium sp. LTSP857]